MRLNTKKFFELAKENKFEAADLYYHRGYALSATVFHGEVDSFNTDDAFAVTARGIINGKFGTVTTECLDKNTPEFLINGIKKTATIIESDNPSIIFKGSKKYHKKNLFNKNVVTGDIKSKIQTMLEIEKKLLAYDERINEVIHVGYEEKLVESVLSNSYGLTLKDKSADYTFFAEISVKQGEEIRTGFKIFASDKPEEFSVDKFVEDVAKDALKKLGSVQCASKKYPVVFDPHTSSLLIGCLLGSIDADQVQKKSSLFIDKLNKQVVSTKLTIIEDPLQKNIFFRYFDDEGVATSKKYLIKKGVLQTYIYTLETASKAGVEPTGNGYRGSSKAGADLVNIVVKPGRKSEQEILSQIKEGVYITELQGLHAGMNAQSGNFSLPASGFMIRDGKLCEPLALITVAGNLVEMFNNVKDVASNSEFIIQTDTTSPSIYIKKMSITGK